MRLGVGVILLSSLVCLCLPEMALGQVRGFSRQQQASLLVYQQQIATQQRLQQQMQMQMVQRQLMAQQRELGQTRQAQQQAFDLLLDPNDPNAGYMANRRGAAVFGQMHYNSSLYNRRQPYYNYDFVARRNRPVPIGLNNLRGLPTTGYGGIIFGNGFGLALPY